jgi:hypothetical protein
MEYSDICEMANNLIFLLQSCSSQDFVDYIVNQVSECGYCDIENYKEILKNKYGEE